MSTIDSRAFELLQYCSQVSRFLVRTNEDQNLAKTGKNDVTNLDSSMPRLMILLRDLVLDIPEGFSSIQDYVDNHLLKVTGADTEEDIKNDIWKAKLRKCFPQRDAHAVVFPCDHEDDVKKDVIPPEKLRPRFVKGMEVHNPLFCEKLNLLRQQRRPFSSILLSST